MFIVCVGMGVLCFSLSLMYIPVLLFKARKFALLFTMGSSFFVMRLVSTTTYDHWIHIVRFVIVIYPTQLKKT